MSYPDEIDLGAVQLRRWTLADVPVLSAAVTASLEHLRPWMAWATESGVTEAAMQVFVEQSTLRATDGREATYGVFASADAPPGRLGGAIPPGSILGGVGLHDRLPEPGGVEIGYWLAPWATGRGLMTGIVRRLTEVALATEWIDRVEIHCDETNLVSAAIPRRLGFHLDRVIDAHRPQAPCDTGRDQIWIRRRGAGAPLP